MVNSAPVETLEKLVKIDLDSEQVETVKNFLNNTGYPLSENIPERVWTRNVVGHGRYHPSERHTGSEVILLDLGSVTFGLSSEYKTICDDALEIVCYNLSDQPKFLAYSEAVKEILRNPKYQKDIMSLGKKDKK